MSADMNKLAETASTGESSLIEAALRTVWASRLGTVFDSRGFDPPLTLGPAAWLCILSRLPYVRDGLLSSHVLPRP